MQSQYGFAADAFVLSPWLQLASERTVGFDTEAPQPLRGPYARPRGETCRCGLIWRGFTKVIKHKRFVVGGALLATLVFASTAIAAHFTLFGEASIVSGGNPGNAAQLVSDATAPGYSGVDVSPAVPIAWSDLNTLSYDFNVTDDCSGGGSPVFYLGIDNNGDNDVDGYVRVHSGPVGTYSTCVPGWQSTGNLIGNNDLGRYDYSAIGGSGYSTYSAAPASVTTGNVVEAFIVVDLGWFAPDGEMTILVDNINADGHITTFDPNVPASKDACKQGGWMSLDRADFTPFKNQGDCIQYVNTGK